MQRKILYSIIAVYLGAVAVGAGIVYGGSVLAPAKTAPKPVSLTIVVEGHAGGSNATSITPNTGHDTMMPENLTVYVGQQVSLTVINYDEGGHSITSTALGIDFQIPGRTALGVPSVSHFSFTPNQAGTFLWYCRIDCDAGQGHWAMIGGPNSTPVPGFMAGYITVQNS